MRHKFLSLIILSKRSSGTAQPGAIIFLINIGFYGFCLKEITRKDVKPSSPRSLQLQTEIRRVGTRLIQTCARGATSKQGHTGPFLI